MSADARHAAQLGPYRLLSEIGRGGMGVVYRAVHVETRQQVAVKTVHATTVSVLSMLRREIRALSRLSHPGVVHILDEGVDGGVPWYAMELLQGRTLGEFRDSGSLPRGGGGTTIDSNAETRGIDDTVLSGPALADGGMAPPSSVPSERRPPNPWLFEGLSVIRRLCPTLAYLHGHGVVHRDLKPGNILIRPDGRPVLTDFGLVTQMWGDGGRQMVDAAENGFGTPSYMAPEQINGDPGDPRIDLYALGCILYELVSGQPPFQGSSVRDVLSGHLTQIAQPLGSFVEDVPPGLETLISRLLAKGPRDRLGYADDVVDALDQLGVPAASSDDDPPSRAYLYRPRMIGRSAIRTRVCQPVVAAAGGAGGVSLIAAESGAGKTTMAASVGEFARNLGFQVVTAACGAAGREADAASADLRAAPMQAFRPVLQAMADRCVGEGLTFTRELLGATGRVLGAHEPAIDQLATAAGLPQLPEIPADAALDRLVTTFARSLSRFVAGRPLLLIFEDLQWADVLSMQVLQSLCGEFTQTRAIAIVGTYRSEETTDAMRALSALAGVETVALPPLDEAEIGEIIGEMLAIHDVPPSLTRLLARCSGGNPLFVREYLRAAVEERRLYRQNGAWTFTADLVDTGLIDHSALPESLRGLVARRISTVGAEAATLLAAASILGTSFDVSMLQETAGLPETTALDALGDLLDRQFLEDLGAGQLAFTHDKIRECVDATLAADERQRLHRAAGVSLERRWIGTPELTLHLAELAHHWKGANDRTKAIEYLGRAGAHSLATSAHHDAVEFLLEALALDEAPASPAHRLRHARWHLTLGESYRCLDDFAKSREHLTRSLALFGWPVPEGTLRMAGGALWQVGVQVATRYGLAPTRVAADQAATIDDATRGCVSLLQVSRVCGDPVLPLYATIRGLNLAERGASAAQRASGFGIWRILLSALQMRGLAARYDVHFERELAATSDPAARAYALVFSSVHYLLTGDWRKCIEAGQQARTHAADAGMRRIWEEASVCVAAAHLSRGDTVQALPLYRAVLDDGRPGVERVKRWAHTGIAISASHMDMLDVAQASVNEMRAMPQDKLEPGDDVMFLSAAAFVALRRGDLTAALRDADLASERMTRIPSYVTEGQSAILMLMDVYLHLWRETPTKERATAAQRSITKAMTIAKRLPFVRTHAIYCRGEYEWTAGAHDKARRSWELALRLAHQHDQPGEAGRAHLALAQLQGQDAEGHAAAARDVFASLNRSVLPLDLRASGERSH